MHSDALRRRVAELLDNWHVKFSKRVTFTLDEWDVYYNGAYMGAVEAANEAEAREAAVYLLPNWPADPAAALGLLAGVRYTHDHWVHHGIERHFIVVEGKSKFNGESAAFAEAATAAWCAWREGAG